MTTKTLTALEMIADMSKCSQRAADRYRDKAESIAERDHVDMKSYHMGEIIGHMDAAKIMKRELERLRNEWQNGGLTYGSFNLPS